MFIWYCTSLLDLNASLGKQNISGLILFDLTAAFSTFHYSVTLDKVHFAPGVPPGSYSRFSCVKCLLVFLLAFLFKSTT